MIQETEEDLQTARSFNLGDAAAALVYDTSIFGVASPVLGTRYRVEVAPTFGSLSYTELLLDYRRYQVLWKPFTLAVRGLHVGRFGSDAEDSRLSSLFVGFPSLVRGYDINSFEFAECQPVATGGCRVIDDLLGSRNAELRFPLVGAFKGEFDYGPAAGRGLPLRRHRRGMDVAGRTLVCGRRTRLREQYWTRGAGERVRLSRRRVQRRASARSRLEVRL